MRCSTLVAISLASALAAAHSAPAQETTASIVGRAMDAQDRAAAGVTVAIRGVATGLSRQCRTGADGRFRFRSLPPGEYELTAASPDGGTASRRGRALVGQTLRADLVLPVDPTPTAASPAAALMLATGSAQSSRAVELRESATPTPVEREMTPAVLLEPGSVVGDAGFNSGFDGLWLYTPGQRYASIGGGSIAENRYLIDGLDVTNLRDGLGSTMVPFELVDQLQLVQGGWSASLAGSTGGVVNLISRRGGNRFRGGASLYWHPEDLQQNEPDALHRPNHDERRQSLELNASLGGPILRDRLFFFGFIRLTDSQWLDLEGAHGIERELSDPYWGGRLDWSPGSRYRVGLTVLDDSVTVEASGRPYDPASGEVGEAIEVTEERRGGVSWVAAFDGVPFDWLALAARVGRNDFDWVDRSGSDRYPSALDCRAGCRPIGLWTSWRRIPTDEDSREAYRLDADWQLGRHVLGSGVEVSDGNSRVLDEYSGGVRYTYRANGGRFPELPADADIVDVRVRRLEGEVGVESEAAFLQDRWAVSDRLTLEAGLRWERHSSSNAAGGTLLEVNDAVLPRLGAVWDPSGAGRWRLFASYGWYQLPVPSRVPVRLGLAETDMTRVYPLDGEILADGSPEGLGPLLEERTLADGLVADPRRMIGSDLDAFKQWELIVGGEWAPDSTWTFGARAVIREITEILEDFTIDEGLATRYGIEIPVYAYYVGNAGCEFDGWYDLDGDGELDPISLSAAELGYPEPERTVLAVELTAARRFADRWSLRASYTWSHSYGNHEGWAGSDDLRGDRPVLSTRWDLPGLMDHSSGDLPNDRRHLVKLAGSYSFPFGLDLGGFGWWSSGRPVNGFGVHPTDELAAQYGAASFYVGGAPCPRGCAGTTDSSWGLDLMVGYGFEAAGVRWTLRVDAFNVLGNDGVVKVEENAESGSGAPDPHYLAPLYFQAPREIRLGLGVEF